MLSLSFVVALVVSAVFIRRSRTSSSFFLLLVGIWFYLNFQNEDSLMRNGASKTPYDFIANLDDAPIATPPGCKVEKLWLIVRHGTRYPSPEGIRLINQRLPELAAQFNVDNSYLEGVVIDADSKMLHDQGRLEMKALAKRVRRRFPELLSDPNDVSFAATSAFRTKDSALAFAEGLFGSKHEITLEERNRLLRPNKRCPKWDAFVKKNPDSKLEKRLLDASLEFHSAFEAKIEDVEAIFNGCLFGQAWNPEKPSPWCSLLNEEQLRLLEFREDLSHYWRDGFGLGRFGKNLGNVVLQDALMKLQETSSTKAFLNFAHSGIILKIFTTLGLYRDEFPLRHDASEKLRDQRKWRLSQIDPFGANIALVLLECPNRSIKVGVFVNERPEIVPGCEDEHWCDFGSLKTLLAEYETGENVCYFRNGEYSNEIEAGSEEDDDEIF